MKEFRNTGYMVSENGEVYNGKRLCAVDVGRTGYGRIWIGPLKKKFFVHRVVAEVYLENPNDYPIVNHKDFNKLNNSVDNLEWCTYLYNSQYNYTKPEVMKNLKGRKIPSFQGSLNKNAKLTEYQVEFIRKNYKYHDSQFGTTGLAKLFNVSQACIWWALKSKNWKVVQEPVED